MTPGCEDCREQLRSTAAKMGVDVVVSTAPPIVRTPYTGGAWTCPHGTRFWAESTGEQVAEWRRAGAL